MHIKALGIFKVWAIVAFLEPVLAGTIPRLQANAKRECNATESCHELRARRFPYSIYDGEEWPFPNVKAPPYFPRNVWSYYEQLDALDYEEYYNKGRLVRRQLEESIRRRSQDRNAYDARYLYAITTESPQFKVELFPSRLIEAAQLHHNYIQWVDIQIENAVEGLYERYPEDGASTILRASYNAPSGTIVIWTSFAESDRLPNDVRLQMSELTFQTWKRHNNGSPRNLRRIVIHHIANDGTLETIRNVAIILGDTPGYVAVYPDSPGSAIDETFSALSGTPNIKPIYHMLIDHHSEFNDLQILAIRTYSEHGFDYILLDLGRTTGQPQAPQAKL